MLVISHHMTHVLLTLWQMKRQSSFILQEQPKKKVYTKKPVYKRQSKIMSGIGEELKFNDATFNTDATTTPTIVGLNTFAAGDTAITRDGNRIKCRSLELRIRYQLEAITANALLRFVVVHDKNANSTAPTWTLVFDSVDISSQRQIGALSRFTILMDKTITLNQLSSAGGVQKGFLKKYIKIREEDLQLTSFADGSSAIPYSNSLTLMYVSDLSSGVADVDVNGTCRLRFVG